MLKASFPDIPLDPVVTRRLLVILVVVDLALIALYGLGRIVSRLEGGGGVPTLFDIANDDSLGEIFNFGKWGVAASAFLLCWWRTRELVCLALGAICLVLLGDDMLQWHERAGDWISVTLGYPQALYLRPADFGEATYWVVVGTTLLALLRWGLVRASLPYRMLGFLAVALFVLMAVVGIGFDLGHMMATLFFTEGGMAHFLGDLGLAILEDGGEMVAISCLAAVAAGAEAEAARRAASSDTG